MTYITKIDSYTKDKKMISARVPEIYLDALYASETDVAEYGLDSTISKIVTIALKNAIEEIKEKLGVDYLAIEKFKHDMYDLQDRLNPQNKRDFNTLGEEIKNEAIKQSQENGAEIDVIPVIEKMKAEIIHDWKNEVPKASPLMKFLLGEP